MLCLRSSTKFEELFRALNDDTPRARLLSGGEEKLVP
jgi:hypothetical protein